MSEAALEADIRGHDKSDATDPKQTCRGVYGLAFYRDAVGRNAVA